MRLVGGGSGGGALNFQNGASMYKSQNAHSSLIISCGCVCWPVLQELLGRSWGTPPMGPNAPRFRSIADVSSFIMVFVLRFYTIRVRALCVEEPQLWFYNGKPTWSLGGVDTPVGSVTYSRSLRFEVF